MATTTTTILKQQQQELRMAASMLNVLQTSKIFTARNSCLLCARSFSAESPEAVRDQDNSLPNTDQDPEKQFAKYAEAARLKRQIKRRKKQTLRGVDPFWIQEEVPLWKSAFSKLLISQPNIDVPTVNYRGIELPRKIKRDPLTVLNALSETMNIEDLGVNYNFVDDPRLLHVGQKEIALKAKLDGKRTAHEMMAMYKKAFVAYRAVPDIPGFNPVTDQYEDTSLSVSALEERINKRKVVHASEIYERLSDAGKEVPLEVEERLLELLCVFNGADPVEQELVHTTPITRPEPVKWKGELAELIFEKHVEAGTVTPYMYNVYVCGMLKHTKYGKEGDTEAKKAINLYTKMKKESIPVFLCTYNLLLRRTHTLNLMEILQDMKKAGVVPTKETLNNAMNDNKALEVKKLLAEKKLAGIDYGFFDMLCIVRAFPRHIEFLEEIIDHMAAQKTWYLDHPRENIFDWMMRHLSQQNDPEVVPVAKKLYQLRKDLGTRLKPQLFNMDRFVCLRYFDIMLNLGTFDDFAEAYKELVPYYIRVSPLVEKIIDKMEREGAPGDMLIDLYQDTFNFVPLKAPIIETILKKLNVMFMAMLGERHSPELRKQFAGVAATFFIDFVDEEQNRLKNSDITKTVIRSEAVKTCLDLMLNEPSYLEKAWESYMAYADKSLQLFNKQDLRWKKMIEKLIEAQDVLKIRQFLNKIKTSSSWVDHKFLKDMKEPLEKVLGEEEREILHYVLSKMK